MNNLNTLTTSELSDLITNGNISSEELVRATLDSIQSNDSKLNSFITVNEENSIKQAKKIDKEMKNNSVEKTFLTGIPILLKDNISTKNIRTTAASKILENYIPPYDSFVTKKL